MLQPITYVPPLRFSSHVLKSYHIDVRRSLQIINISLACNHIVLHSEHTQLSGTTRKRRDTANDGVVWVGLSNVHVQAFQPLIKNVHNLGCDFVNVGILYIIS